MALRQARAAAKPTADVPLPRRTTGWPASSPPSPYRVFHRPVRPGDILAVDLTLCVVCSLARSNGMPYSWEAFPAASRLPGLAGRCAFDVFPRSARIEAGTLGHLRVSAETPVQERGITGKKLLGRELTRAQLPDQRVFLAGRGVGDFADVAAGEQNTPHRLLELAHVSRPAV